MWNYFLRRLILLPITLFFIILVNFVIVNLAPGEPTSVTNVSEGGQATRSEAQSAGATTEDRYLQFREFYGLTLPILFNLRPWTTLDEVKATIWQLEHKRYSSQDPEEMNFKDFDKTRIAFGDEARFVMPLLHTIMNDPTTDPESLRIAVRGFIRGGARMAIINPNLTTQERSINTEISRDNELLYTNVILPTDPPEEVQKKLTTLNKWYEKNWKKRNFQPDSFGKIKILLAETRFVKYMSRVLTLNFGVMRNDPNKTVTSEVVRRFKYSLTLSLTPLILTFFFCQIFGMIMAYNQARWPDYTLNLTFLILYAIPVFVVAPFLIAKVALNNNFPFTDIPIPTSGFTSPESVYSQLTSSQKLMNTILHLILPITCIIYGSLAAQSRLSRTAILEVLRQDYVRTAKAKGVPSGTIMFRHVGRNAGITIVTSIAGSLGIVLGGSLIVETLFQINGFGKFFYDAILNRDYNVVMFSALAGSFLTLFGYLIADIAYTLLDPRVTLE